jgi:hypothetical protein
MHNKDIIFDLDNKKIGLVDSNCSGLNIIKNITYVEDADRVVKSKFEKECENKIQTYLTAICLVLFIAFIVIVFLLLGIYRLKKNKNFLWMKMNESRNLKII